MAMDVKFTALAYCLLALLFNVNQTENQASTPQPTFSLTLTTLTPSDSTSAISNLTEKTTLYTSTELDNKTLVSTTAATTERTSHHRTSQSATTLTPLTNSTTLRTTTSSTQMSTFTAQTTAAIQTTVDNLSAPSTPVITTENATHAGITTSCPVNRTTQDLGLNVSERNMTIVFSTVLGTFAVLLVFLMFHKCKQKIQYLHQPLNNADYTDTFGADDDTLVISGGLYDGHPIYDNVPTAPADQSQFHLEFLH